MKDIINAIRLFFIWVCVLIAGGLGLLFFISPAPALAQGTAPNLDSAARYAQCIQLVSRDPDQAFDRAQAWRTDGGGAAARHCEALALVELKLYGEAAVRLGDLADAPDAGGPGDRAALLAQAGNAWLLAGSGENAVVALSAALTLTPGDVDMLIDRARGHAAVQNYAAADADLTQALAQRPDATNVLVLRAAARRVDNNLDAASADISQALSLTPNDPFALVERGSIRLARGDTQGARADWVAVARIVGEVDPDDPHATALRDAQRNLEALDVEQ